MNRAGWLAILSASALCLFASRARADVARFAVIVGNDRGSEHETPLQYAQTDARKVHDTLRDLGGFEPYNMVLLEGRDANTLRRSLIALNERVRALQSRPDTQVVLLVYYSGHADREDLHLGDSRLPLDELSGLVRGSAADFRLLVLDACRSGVVTRAKGGVLTAPFPIPEPIVLRGEGLAFLTASSEQEAAQESTELRGSFFTHALVSGLLGAADRDRDGNVSLDEAYQYAYEGTLRASSRSASGLQHPTFFYDLRGQGQLVLTRPFVWGERRGTLELPAAATYLVFRDDADGQVAAEVYAHDPVRSLSLSPGRYFVRGRAGDYALEGSTQVASARTTRVDTRDLTRIEYAQLVRKGQSERHLAQAVELGATMRSPLPNSRDLCFGLAGGYRVDTERASWSARGTFCQDSREGATLRVRTSQVDLGLRALRVWDVGSFLALEAGAGVSAVYFEQHFSGAESRAPSRRSFATLGELAVALSTELGRSVYGALDVAAQCYVLRLLDQQSRETALRAAFAARVSVSMGTRF